MGWKYFSFFNEFSTIFPNITINVGAIFMNYFYIFPEQKHTTKALIGQVSIPYLDSLSCRLLSIQIHILEKHFLL